MCQYLKSSLAIIYFHFVSRHYDIQSIILYYTKLKVISLHLHNYYIRYMHAIWYIVIIENYCVYDSEYVMHMHVYIH